MSEGEGAPPRPTKEAIIEQVRRALGPSGTTIPTAHLFQRLKDRGRDMQDVLKVLETGSIRERVGNPRYDDEHRVWTCRLDGQDIDGRSHDLLLRKADARDSEALSVS